MQWRSEVTQSRLQASSLGRRRRVQLRRLKPARSEARGPWLGPRDSPMCGAWSALGRTRLEEDGAGPHIWGFLGPAESGLVKGVPCGVRIKDLPGEGLGPTPGGPGPSFPTSCLLRSSSSSLGNLLLRTVLAVQGLRLYLPVPGLWVQCPVGKLRSTALWLKKQKNIKQK